MRQRGQTGVTAAPLPFAWPGHRAHGWALLPDKRGAGRRCRAPTASTCTKANVRRGRGGTNTPPPRRLVAGSLGGWCVMGATRALEQQRSRDWVVTQPNRSSGAKSQRIVATRPLNRLQYPLALSRLQRIYPDERRNCHARHRSWACDPHRGTEWYALACKARIISR